jgi:creatinine amidohydrolase
MKWAELREEEFDDAVKKTGGVCIIPVGCYEMHGQHLPVRTDVYEAEALAFAAAEREPACVFPAFEFGDSSPLVRWNGAVRMEPKMMLRILEGYCTEIARNGFDKIILLNFHGGNVPFLNYFMSYISYKQRDFTVLSAFPAAQFKDIVAKLDAEGDDVFPELLPEDVAALRDYVENNRLGGHGDLMETSMMLAIRPDLVRMDRLGVVDGHSTKKTDKMKAAGLLNSRAMWDIDFPNTYSADDPYNASERIGRLFIRLGGEMLANACRILKEDYTAFRETIDFKRPFYHN